MRPWKAVWGLCVALGAMVAHAQLATTAQGAAHPLGTEPSAAAEVHEESPHYTGDLGLGFYRLLRIAGVYGENTWFPYVYGDYGRWYGRVDTFGYKALPLGYGHLELSTRVSFEGYRPNQPGLQRRSAPHLLGLGTFQETPWGGLFAYAFKDIVSGGHMLDVTYAAEFHVGRWAVYPEAGITRRSASYVQHLYGVNARQSEASGVGFYAPGGSNVPNAGWAMEYPISDHYKWVTEVKRRWLDASLTQSPLVMRKVQDSFLLSLNRVY
jgi:outer membrane protein